MSAQVIDFASAVAKRARILRRVHRAAQRPRVTLTNDFMYWTGASGRRYVHTVYNLIDCPELPNCNVVLVRRGTSGQRHILHVGRLERDAPCLNLADLRRQGALLAANEVHVHLLASTASERGCIELDLCAAEERHIQNRSAS